MNFQKLTLKSQEAFRTAKEIAANYNNQAIEPVHIMAAIIQDNSSIVVDLIQKIGLNINIV
ncbi:MAG: Clp protease N-terminal domain-containing protein, partial [Candidatus Kapaibacteriota bacterium]